MEVPSLLTEELGGDIAEKINRIGDGTDMNIQTDNANNQCYTCIRSPSLDSCHQSELKTSIEFKDLIYAVFQGRGLEPKFLLKSISGTFESGELVALMGPSGAGKSTLLNILAGFKTRNVSGQILVNGKPRNLTYFRKTSCFIMQDAPVLPQLTVDEAMYCSSQLNLPRCCPEHRRKRIIDDILQTLGLSEARQTLSCELSGGQRKRLSIAQEMINNPPIMFFDEPTSGLDSASSLQCILALQTIAKQGRTVVCTIHQPSATVFDIFDQLYFLEAGQCLYRGPVRLLVPYLASLGLQCPRYHNPSDFLMDIASAEEDGSTTSILLNAVASGRLGGAIARLQETHQEVIPKIDPEWIDKTDEVSITGKNGKLNKEDFIEAANPGTSITNAGEQYVESSAPRATVERGGHPFDVGLFHQTKVLTKRTLICIWRDKTLTRLRLMAHVVVGILIGLLYFNAGNNGFQVINNAAFIFFSVLFIMFSSLMPTVMTFPLEMRVFVTEHLNYWYSVRAYYLAKTLADLPFQVIFAVIYGVIVYFMTDQPVDFVRFMIFLTMLVLTGLVGQAQGLLIGAATDLEVAVFLGPATGIPILLFSGFFITLDTIPKYLQWLSYGSFTRYAFEGSMKGIYGRNRSEMNCNKKPTSNPTLPCLNDPKAVLTLLSISQYDVGFDLIVLNVFFVVLRVLCFFVLKWRCRNAA